MAWFYEIRTSSNAVLKRDGGFATQDAATTAGRADAKKINIKDVPENILHAMKLLESLCNSRATETEEKPN